eukprot:9786354-Prorocentrum_lima.AAC.1
MVRATGSSRGRLLVQTRVLEPAGLGGSVVPHHRRGERHRSTSGRRQARLWMGVRVVREQSKSRRRSDHGQ